MKEILNFLNAISLRERYANGHKERVFIRGLTPKNTQIQALEARGMTYKKDGKVHRSTVNGYLDLVSGEFHQLYGDRYKPHINGWGYLQDLNKQGYGIYFVVSHGGTKNGQITHGTTLFHESDGLSFEEQQQTIERISSELGKPTAVVKTRKSLHSYWASSEIIPIEKLANYQRRWCQYSGCDDGSLDDPAQLMRLPGFDHVAWNPETKDFDRVKCELLQLNNVSYSLADFDRILPELDLARWAKKSLRELEESEVSPLDMRAFAPYLDGYQENGRDGWDTAKCPAHGGESFDSLHIHPDTGAFICHAGCSSSSVYHAAKTKAFAGGYRLEVTKPEISEEVSRLLLDSKYEPSSALPSSLRKLILAEAKEWNLPTIVYIVCLLATVLSLAKVENFLQVRETNGKPILWVVLVGTSNSGKSEILKTIVAPLKDFQKGAEEKYAIELANYQRELYQFEKLKRSKTEKSKTEKSKTEKSKTEESKTEESKTEEFDPASAPIPPSCRDYYLDDYTYESLGQQCFDHKGQNLLIRIDEFKGFLEFEKYGSVNNRSRMLSLYDGDAIKITRKTSGRIFVPDTAVSLISTTQYTTLRNILAKDPDSEDGLWARVVFVNVPTTKVESHDPDPNNPLQLALEKIYILVGQFKPESYTASPEAQQLWTEWYNSMSDRVLDRCGTFLESIYGKSRDRVARIALALHLLHAAAEEREPNPEVSEKTMHHAIELGKLFLLETEKALFLTDANPETTDLEDTRILKFVERFKGKGWVNTRAVSRWWTTKPFPSADECRSFMSKVVSIGYAIDNGESPNSTKYQIQISKIDTDNTDKTPQPKPPKAFEGVGNNTDNSDKSTDKTGLNPADYNLSNVVSTLGNDTDNSEMAINGHLSDRFVGIVSTDSINVGTSTDSIKSIHTNGFKDSVSIVSTFSEDLETENLKSMADSLEASDHSDRSSDKVADTADNPRDAITIANGRVEVDLDRLDLNYQPLTPIPQWTPSKTLKPYEELSKIYLDIETTGLDFNNDRVLMVGIMNERGEKTIITDTDERVILDRTMDYLNSHKPECLIGHNLFEFDLRFLAQRCLTHKVKHPFSKADKTSRITSSSVNGKPIEFTPIYWTGVNSLDTYQQIAIWDKAAAKLTGYGLKDSTIALGLRDDRRLELSVNEIRDCWDSGDLEKIEEYLLYDLEDTKLLADFLLPVVYFQMVYVPDLNFQQIAIASPALKAQKIHQKLIPNVSPMADEPVKYEGGKIELITPGLHHNVAKIDVSSLYPSIMLRYGICSWKDNDNKFLGVLDYMRSERLRLKEIGKQGDKSASFQEKALKVLINGSYGFMGTGGYSFNDFEAAALVTAYGRKILNLMVDVVSSCGGTVIEIDTDGILFSHNKPETVSQVVSEALPQGISIELELSGCGLYAPKAKNYVIVHPNGKTTVKGLYRKRDRYQLENEFPIEFLKRYFNESPADADDYYNQTRQRLIDRVVDVSQLTVNKKIPASDKKLTGLGLGKHGDRISYWITEQRVYHQKTDQPLSSQGIETNTAPYWVDYYLDRLDKQYKEVTENAVHR